MLHFQYHLDILTTIAGIGTNLYGPIADGALTVLMIFLTTPAIFLVNLVSVAVSVECHLKS